MSWDSIKASIYKKYSKNAGKMILHTGVITWTLSSLAQIGAIVYNDKIPKEQKKFLIPQEIADGLLNIAAFYIVTKSLKDIAGKLVSTGKWSNQTIRNFVEESGNKIKMGAQKMGDFKTNLPKTFEGNEEFYTAYEPFKNGIDMIATTIGSVVSCNVVTPFIRNSIGAKQQKQSLAKENVKKEQTPISAIKMNPVFLKNTSMKV